MPQRSKMSAILPTIAVLTAALTAACAPTQQTSGQPTTTGMTAQQPTTMQQGTQAHQSMMQEGSISNSPGSQAMMGSMRTMQQAMMAQPMTGDTDHDFASMMREHHRGAVDMARVEIQNGRDPELQKMARKVITDQEKEIRQLDRWLARHPAKPPQG